MSPTLACGPWFRIDETGMWVSAVMFLLIKPLAYFAFIQAFRYRVSRPIPMRFGQAVKLTLARTGLSIALVGAGAVVVWFANDPAVFGMSWIYLYAERLFSWWLVGAKGAGLVGRRLLGWVISGTLINAAFDIGMVGGVFDGWLWPAAVMLAVAVFIGLLHVIGRRDSLKWRFKSGILCTTCGYSLVGNLSGRCPECGTPLSLPAMAVVPSSATPH